MSLGHKLMGAELMYCCQMVYLTYGFMKKSSFLFSTVKGLKLVSGGWSLFHKEEYTQGGINFMKMIEINPYFIENSLIIGLMLIFFMIVLGILMAIRFMTIKQEG